MCVCVFVVVGVRVIFYQRFAFMIRARGVGLSLVFSLLLLLPPLLMLLLLSLLLLVAAIHFLRMLLFALAVCFANFWRLRHNKKKVKHQTERKKDAKCERYMQITAENYSIDSIGQYNVTVLPASSGHTHSPTTTRCLQVPLPALIAQSGAIFKGQLHHNVNACIVLQFLH